MMHRTLTLILLLLSTSLFAKPLIIFDAGSTGTRLYVYEVNAGEATQIHSIKIKPGLSDLSPSLYSHYFKLLLDSTHDLLDDATKAQTPVYLYATAGVRMLSPTQQDAIFNGTAEHPGVRSVLAEQAEAYGYPAPSHEQIRVISGTEEGMFVWIADNYLKGSFNAAELRADNTVGALEMGGASSEVAFISHNIKEYGVPFPHHNNHYDVYSYGYDGLGMNEAMKRMTQAYAKKGGHFAACFPVGAPYPPAPEQPILIGKGNFNGCVKTIKKEFANRASSQACQSKHGRHCSALGVYQPPTRFTDHYLLTGGAYYVFDTLGLSQKPVKLPVFLSSAQNYCAQDWSTLQAQDPNNPYLVNYCFNAALTKVLLDVLHVKKATTLEAVNSIADKPLEWPLGAALSLGDPSGQ